MKKSDAKTMMKAMSIIYELCEQNHGKGCNGCPANGRGMLCHSGEISCCAPHHWYMFKSEDADKSNK